MVNIKSIIKSRHSVLAEKLLYLDGKPFSLKDYPHMRMVYDINCRELVLKTSRQIGKSTTLANKIIIHSIINSHFRTLYISPRQDQTKPFSRERLGPTMMNSPIIKRNYIDSRDDQNVFFKQFNNGSVVNLRYAYLNADAIRGFSTDMNLFDECQDLVEDVIPVANQTLTRSLYKKIIYAGTPKRTQGTLAKRWYLSSQNEWAIKCNNTGCSIWNVPLDDRNIGSKGVICSKCGKTIDPRLGQWVCIGDKDSRLIGFRVSALMFSHAPWVDWQKDILDYREHHGEAKFYNEVLGLEYDDGVSPLTIDVLRTACNSQQLMSYKLPTYKQRVMGLDYGPVNSANSYTFMACGRWTDNDIFQFEYFKRYTGFEADPAIYHDDIAEKFYESGALRIGADWGMGEASNAEIRKRIGYEKIIAYMYNDAQKERSKYNPKIPGYILSKVKIMTEFIDAIKNGKVRFPRWEEFQKYYLEFTNVSIEYDEDRNKTRFTKIGTDDGFHAALYCWMAAQLVRNLT